MDAGVPGARSKWWALAAMMLAVSMTFIDQTVVAIAAPVIADDLGLSRSASQWTVTAYLLPLAAGFAFGGRLADVVGHRRIVLIGIVGFAVTSLLCGLTPAGELAEAWIVTFRALQGVAAALMIPAALAVVVASFPVRERGRALALFFGISGGLTAVGPLAGGALTAWTWRSIFWINLPVAVVALLLTLAAPVAHRGTREALDLRGAVLLAAGMAMSVFGLEQTLRWGWGDARTWAFLLGGALLLVVFWRWQLRAPTPLLRVRIFRDRAFLVDNLVLFLSMIAFVPVFFFASVYAQISLDFSATQAGLYILIFFGGFGPAAQIAGRILDLRGARSCLIVGSALGAVGFAAWAWSVTTPSLGAQWWTIVLAGAGIGFLLGPASTDAVNRAPDASYGEVTGISQTIRNYGSAVGMAVMSTVLGWVLFVRLEESLVAAGVPADRTGALAQILATEGAVPVSFDGEPVTEAVRTALAADFATATQAALGGMAVALLVAFLVSWAHPGGRVTAPAAASVQPG